MKRIFVTKIEVLCVAAKDFAGLSSALSTNTAAEAVSEFEFHRLSPALPCFRVKGIDPAEVLGKKGLRNKDWATKLLLCTLEKGFRDLLDGMRPDDGPGICIGTAFGSVESIGNFLSESIVGGINGVNPQAFANTVINAPASNANIRFGLRMLSATVSTGSNASLDAMVYAFHHLQQGHLDWIIVGGVEEISYYELAGLNRCGLLAPDGISRPFAKNGPGIVVGEACALFLFETEEHARARGVQIVGEIAGCSTAFNPSQGEDGGVEAAIFVMNNACRQAGIAPSELGFVAASASGHPRLDHTEAHALYRLCPSVPVTAYKRKIGECFGASTAASLACAIADMQANRLTGVGNSYEVMNGPAIVQDDRVGFRPQTALINALSCEGHCGSIIFKIVEE